MFYRFPNQGYFRNTYSDMRDKEKAKQNKISVKLPESYKKNVVHIFASILTKLNESIKRSESSE